MFNVTTDNILGRRIIMHIQQSYRRISPEEMLLRWKLIDMMDMREFVENSVFVGQLSRNQYAFMLTKALRFRMGDPMEENFMRATNTLKNGIALLGAQIEAFNDTSNE